MKLDAELASKIKAGKVGVMPTDTIYGLVASAFSSRAVNRVYKLKQRPASFPLIILISSLADLKQFNIKLTAKQKAVLAKIWPNSVSVILPCPEKKFKYLHRRTETLSFRLPKEKWLTDFLKQSGPIIATSANIHNHANAKNIEDAEHYFDNSVDFYVNGDEQNHLASTVIDLTRDKIYLFRDGVYQLPKNLPFHRIIRKKTWPDLFQALKAGQKKFDLRVADFSAEVGDILLFQEFDPKASQYTGRTLKKEISYVLKFNPEAYPFATPEDVKKHGLQIFSLD